MVWGLFPPSTAFAAEGSQPASCPSAQSLLREGRLEQAQKQFLIVLAANPSAGCAIRGLNHVTAAEEAERRFCSEGDELAAAGKTEDADARYEKALAKNVGSECAKEGLNPPKEQSLGDEIVGAIGDAIAYLPKIPPALGALFTILLVFFVAIALVVIFRARQRGSLVVRPFADGAVSPSIGAGVAGLVGDRLVGLGRRGEQSHDGIDLDFVVADLELLAEDEELADAVGSMAEVSQLGLAIALLEFADRFLPSSRLAVGGELLPAGPAGPGLSLALYRRNGIRARGTLWHDEVKDWLPAAAGGGGGGGADDPSPYYALAGPAAWWVQYEAARSIDSSASMITDSARSFALMGAGIALQRDEDSFAALSAYSQALEIDAGNVAALTNMANLAARLIGLYVLSVLMLEQAQQALEEHYLEAAEG
jgi:tetratricopeptide (TPR) repeat protein